MALVGAVGTAAKAVRAVDELPEVATGTLKLDDVDTVKPAQLATPTIAEGENVGTLKLDDVDDYDSSAPTDYTPPVEVVKQHEGEDKLFADYLIDKVGFNDIDPGVNGEAIKMYTDAFDTLYDVLPFAKNTPRKVLSLRGRLSLKPFSKGAFGEQAVPDTTRGVFANHPMDDNPRIFVRRPESEEDYFNKVRVVHHEWFHALDDYLGSHFEASYKYNPQFGLIGSSGKSTLDEMQRLGRQASAEGARLTGMRPEVFETWDRLRTAILTPAMRDSVPNMAKRVPEYPKGEYLQKNEEMMARAFEQYMSIKEAKHAGEAPRIARGQNYPFKSEMMILEPLFDDFFGSLKVKEAKSPKGKPTPMWYGIGGAAAGTAGAPDTAQAKESLVDKILKRNAALEEAAGSGIPTRIKEEAPEGAPTIDQLSSEEQSEYIMSDYDSVEDYLASKQSL